MKSKEAIRIAYEECKQYICDEETDQPIIEVFEALKQAEKDLEILEILKSKIRISNYLDVRMLDFPLFLLPMSKEESDKIKEWLENDTKRTN